MDIEKMIDELYRVVAEYENVKNDKFDFRLDGLYSQIEVLEAIKNGSGEEILKLWHKCLLEDKSALKID